MDAKNTALLESKGKGVGAPESEGMTPNDTP